MSSIVSETMPDLPEFFSFSLMSERLGISIEAMLDIAGRILEEGTDALEKAQIPYWLSAGTVLGLYRDGNLIVEDSDIDVGVTSEIPIERIEEALLDAGFEANRFRNSHGVPCQRAFVKDGLAFDVTIYYPNGEYYIHHTPGGIIKKPKHLLEDLQTISFNGKEYPIPNPKKYLKWRYGDWQTPSSGKGVYDESFRDMAKPDDELTFKVA